MLPDSTTGLSHFDLNHKINPLFKQNHCQMAQILG